MTFVITAGQIDLSVGAIVAFVAAMSAELIQAGVDSSLGLRRRPGDGCGLGPGQRMARCLSGYSAVHRDSGDDVRHSRYRAVIGPKDSPFRFRPTLTSRSSELLSSSGSPPAPGLLSSSWSSEQLRSTACASGATVTGIGSNVESVRRSGVNTRRVLMMTLVFTGLAAGIAGLLIAARLGSGFGQLRNGIRAHGDHRGGSRWHQPLRRSRHRDRYRHRRCPDRNHRQRIDPARREPVPDADHHRCRSATGYLDQHARTYTERAVATPAIRTLGGPHAHEQGSYRHRNRGTARNSGWFSHTNICTTTSPVHTPRPRIRLWRSGWPVRYAPRMPGFFTTIRTTVSTIVESTTHRPWWKTLRTSPALGGRTIVDLTPPGLGRAPEKLAEFSRKSDVRVIMGSGWYLETTHPVEVHELGVDDLAGSLVEEFDPAKELAPGVIGEIGVSPLFTQNEAKALRAACIAQREVDVPLFVHLPGWQRVRTSRRRHRGRRDGRRSASSGPVPHGPVGTRRRLSTIARRPRCLSRVRHDRDAFRFPRRGSFSASGGNRHCGSRIGHLRVRITTPAQSRPLPQINAQKARRKRILLRTTRLRRPIGARRRRSPASVRVDARQPEVALRAGRERKQKQSWVKRVLIAGESWMTTSTHVQGRRRVQCPIPTSRGVGPLRDALTSRGHDVTHMPAHLVPTQFPGTAEALSQFDVVVLSDIGANSLQLAPRRVRPVPRRRGSSCRAT